eukprot:9683547-Lingulodinium_polyedra.AAC.1
MPPVPCLWGDHGGQDSAERRHVLRLPELAGMRRVPVVQRPAQGTAGAAEQGKGQVGALRPVRRALQAAARQLDASLQEALELTTKAGQCDLLEVATTRESGLASAVEARGGTAYRASVWNDFDLATQRGQERLRELVQQLQPRHIWFSPPCTPWSQLQATNQRTPEQCARLASARRRGRRILSAVAGIMLWANQELGCQCHLEQPR